MPKQYEYSIVVQKQDEGGYWVEVPALPGCYTHGDSLEEAVDNARQTIETYLELLVEHRRRIPLDSEIVFRVSVSV